MVSFNPTKLVGICQMKKSFRCKTYIPKIVVKSEVHQSIAGAHVSNNRDIVRNSCHTVQHVEETGNLHLPMSKLRQGILGTYLKRKTKSGQSTYTELLNGTEVYHQVTNS